MTKSLKMSTKIVLLFVFIIAITASIVGGWAAWTFKTDLSQTVIEQQNSGLRTAAALLKKQYPETSFTIDKKGKVHDLVMNGIATFANHEMIDEIGETTGETVTVFKWEDESKDFWRVTTNIIKGDGARAVGTPLGKTGKVYPIIMAGKTFNGEATILGRDYYTIYEPILSPKGDKIGILYAGVLKEKINAGLSNIINALIVASLIATLIGAVITIIVLRGLMRPIPLLATMMEKVAAGDLTIENTYVDRKDEVGEMAQALEVFRANAEEKGRMEKERLESEKQYELTAQSQRKALSEEFKASVETIVKQVSSSVQNLTEIAQGMSKDSELALSGTSQATGSTRHATESVNTVAAASEELAASINEIMQQVQRSGQVAANATQEADGANSKMDQLTTAAQKIGEVVSLIAEIAEQTNLLALNATIEAARAGEAGKGFAVVASEVKSLASQTAKATEEIEQQVNDIQSATGSVGGAIKDIQTIIDEINQISTVISSSIEEQSSATAEIASSISVASQNTSTASEQISLVENSVNQTNGASQNVLAASTELQGFSKDLSEKVDGFISRMG
ncbi:methyl-accepting chemotaxis protein [Kiloniella antarctica]|uniref:Methyl-accepting chemotaxis protein n=1 Tax=Kiloniella antarctica TaxID=1550907 RepID=A0ABW5BR01_9PROT